MLIPPSISYSQSSLPFSATSGYTGLTVPLLMYLLLQEKMLHLLHSLSQTYCCLWTSPCAVDRMSIQKCGVLGHYVFNKPGWRIHFPLKHLSFGAAVIEKKKGEKKCFLWTEESHLHSFSGKLALFLSLAIDQRLFDPFGIAEAICASDAHIRHFFTLGLMSRSTSLKTNVLYCVLGGTKLPPTQNNCLALTVSVDGLAPHFTLQSTEFGLCCPGIFF